MMDAAYEAALQAKAPVTATLIRLAIPDIGPICLTDGGFVDYDGGAGVETYYGDHATVGLFSQVSSVKDGIGGQSSRIDITILPRDDEAMAALGSPLVQGSPVWWWEGAINPLTGRLIGDPLLKFVGEIDKPRLGVGDNWALVLECGTEAERQLEPNDNWRLNPAFHTTIWPDETGLNDVTGVRRPIYWRMASPNGSIKT